MVMMTLMVMTQVNDFNGDGYLLADVVAQPRFILTSSCNTVRLRLNGFGPPFRGRFATVSDRFSGSWCRFLESWGQDGEDGEKTGKKRRKMGEKWPKESGSNDGLTANAEYCAPPSHRTQPAEQC